MKKVILRAAVAATAAACNNTRKTNEEAVSMEHIQIDTAAFVQEVDGKQVGLYFLKNKNGLEMAVTNFGAKVVALAVSDKNGNFEDIVLGYDNLDGYLNSCEKYFGAAIGRYGNRIAGGKFNLNGKEDIMATNKGPK